MVKVPRRVKNGKAHPPTPAPRRPPEPSEPPPGRRRSPYEELEARLAEPEEGPFLYGLDQRAIYPTLLEQVTEAGDRILTVLSDHDYFDDWRAYEDLEAELGFVRERASFAMGWEHGSADGRAEAFRSRAPGLSRRAKKLADQARALVVNGQMSPIEAAALLLETTWSILLTRPAPPFDG